MVDKPELIGEFDCPVCGSKERFCESLAKEVKEKGWMRPEMNFYAQIWQGAVSDDLWVHKIPIGSKVPSYHIYVDVCMGFPGKPCGCIYAVKLERGVGMKIAEATLLTHRGRDNNIPLLKSTTEIPDAIRKAFDKQEA